ncbi:hypothetical protein Verru16b_00168 [Lacunisphaera limnophila]|uniref:DUF4256 domain-containing protein n=1 Tax=Lacunisphaera limnophila TaxID=1838286 RepID=A0A1I7PHN8_9BACT|nr:DUF4256 domain-containing protein [Lacunisphaera limnophila]AOS43127.1 hypothetical protein Verru16b_00168 [Lacunisphaera limnophila]
MAATAKKRPAAPRPADLLAILRARFEQNQARHADLTWARVQTRLEANPAKLAALAAMEHSGGEPDVTGQDSKTGEFLFIDCAPQSPVGRQSLCYDRAALDGRKKFPPKGCVTELAAALGIELLTEERYHALQQLGEFDTKTSSWLQTPADIRKLGGAIYGDRRYNRVFIGHNGADSYYSGRGFRGLLRV